MPEGNFITGDGKVIPLNDYIAKQEGNSLREGMEAVKHYLRGRDPGAWLPLERRKGLETTRHYTIFKILLQHPMEKFTCEDLARAMRVDKRALTGLVSNIVSFVEEKYPDVFQVVRGKAKIPTQIWCRAESIVRPLDWASKFAGEFSPWHTEHRKKGKQRQDKVRKVIEELNSGAWEAKEVVTDIHQETAKQIFDQPEETEWEIPIRIALKIQITVEVIQNDPS